MAEHPGRGGFDAVFRTLSFGQDPALDLRGTVRAEGLELAVSATLAVPSATEAEGEAPLPRVPLGDTPGADFVVLERLGEGGMGVVELARQRSLAREVAVKRLRADATDAKLALALLHEARTMGGLEHPNVVPVHALGVDEAGRPALVMKRVDGVSWSELLAEPEHPLWESVAPAGQDRLVAHLEVLRQVCNALGFAHARGVLHRDLKPDNVMLGAHGEVYLLDWGVALERASVTEASKSQPQVVGTPCFMPPELWGGTLGEHDERTDVYLLGATLHYVLTGRPRHEGGTLEAVLASSWESRPVAYPAAVPEELAALCNEATAREPSKRPASVEHFRRRVGEFLQHRSSVALARSAKEALRRALAESAAARAARAHLSEAHFGYVQALREWPENPAAREGLQACLEALLERELALRNAEGAAALLEELPEPRPPLRDRVAALERELGQERAEAEDARREAREMDSSSSARARIALLLGGFVLTGVALELLSRLRPRPSSELSSDNLLESDLVVLVIGVVGVSLARKRLFANKIGRRFTLLFSLLLASVMLSDVLEWHLQRDLYSAVLHRFLVGTAVLTGGAFTLDLALLVPAGLMCAGGLSLALVPRYAVYTGNGASLLAVLSMVWATVRHARAARARVEGATP